MKRMNALFLDVDGVLNSNLNKEIKRRNNQPVSSYYISLPGDKLFKLRKIIDATDAKIILSSSWRLGGLVNNPSYAQMNLERQLNDYGMSIYDITPSSYNRNRGVEISRWLEWFKMKMGYVPNYIILDNIIHDLLSDHKGHIVNIPESVGLQDRHVLIAINLLRKQEREFVS